MADLAREDLQRRLRDRGPTRVVVDTNGSATTAFQASRDYKVQVDVVFVRKDGWMLGAPARLEHVARWLWADEWLWVARRPFWELRGFG